MKSTEASLPLYHGSSSGNSSSRRDNFRCCLCCHVRTATICFGMWHVVMHILLFVLLLMTLQHPCLLKQFQPTDTNLVKSTQSSYLLPENTDKAALYDHTVEGGQDYYTLYIRSRHWGKPDVKLALFITMCTFILSLMLLYGAIKSRPIYLMPFFCFQVLDLGISFVTLANYFSNMPDIRHVISQSNLPFREQLLEMEPHCLNVAFLLVFIASILVQTYFLNMVWSCYKYLVMREFMRSTVSSYVITDSESQMPPDYETATKLPKYFVDLQTPPPPYPAEAEQETTRPEGQQQQQQQAQTQATQ